MANFYRQCNLRNGNSHTTSWLPEEYAVKGKVLKLKKDDESWEDGWIVESAGDKIDEKCLPDFHREIKAHKKRTGDSLPKCPKPS